MKPFEENFFASPRHIRYALNNDPYYFRITQTINTDLEEKREMARKGEEEVMEQLIIIIRGATITTSMAQEVLHPNMTLMSVNMTPKVKQVVLGSVTVIPHLYSTHLRPTQPPPHCHGASQFLHQSPHPPHAPRMFIITQIIMRLLLHMPTIPSI